MGMKPEPVYLKVGDKMDVWIDGLGQQTQMVAMDE
jgi:2-keto-4-pentenoate hydratase/2-oxohepta-3-ene-1,7-dioic acid hydratase in catechol pathway